MAMDFAPKTQEVHVILRPSCLLASIAERWQAYWRRLACSIYDASLGDMHPWGIPQCCEGHSRGIWCNGCQNTDFELALLQMILNDPRVCGWRHGGVLWGLFAASIDKQA
jgi:hypothetical protein